MVSSKATTVAQYLKELPADRAKAIKAVRKVIRDNIDGDIEEMMSYGMIGYHVSRKAYPDGYHCNPDVPLPYMSLASQKNNLAVYMMGLYTDPADAKWFEKAWKATGKKLDMGKSCVRFKTLEDIPLDVLAEAIKRMPSKRYIAAYEERFAPSKKGPAKKGTAKKAPAKKAAKK